MGLVRQKLRIFTIGHSSRLFDEFLSLLREFKISALIDIRRFPGSRKFPHFNRQSLEITLPASGIEYLWLEYLGGRRSGPDLANSLNPGLKSPAFRHYADYMQTEQFQNAIKQLLLVASLKPAAVMCAEKLFWKCHRRLLSDYLTAQGVQVEHIIDSARLQSHKLSEGAVVTPELNVIYRLNDNASGEPKLFD